MPIYNVRIKRMLVSGWVIAAILVLTLSGIYTLFLRGTLKTKDDSLLDEIYRYFISLEEYNYKTVEEGPGYSLTFKGLSRQNCLTGEIVGHNLHILFQNNGFLFIKDGNGKWEKAAELGLDNLRAFIREPLFIIGGLKDKVPLIRFANDKASGGENVYSASIEEHKDELAKYLFPGIGTDLINSVILSVGIENNKVKEITILLEMKENGGSESPNLTRKIIIEAGAAGENSRLIL